MVSAGEWPRMFGDPRSKEAVKPYKRVPVKEEDQDPDFRALASLALGMAGLFMKGRSKNAVPPPPARRVGRIRPFP